MSKELAVGLCLFDPFYSEDMRQNAIKCATLLNRVWPHVFFIELIYTPKHLNSKSIKSELPSGVNYLQIKAKSVMFVKEQLMNICARHAIDKGYQSFMALDADILFDDELWPQRIISRLEDYKVVEGYKTAEWGWNPDTDECMIKDRSTVRVFFDQNAYGGFPGGAWAADDEFWTELGFFEDLILGPGDALFAASLTDRYAKKNPVPMADKVLTMRAQKLSESFVSQFREYEQKIADLVGHKFFYANQHVRFLFHGSKKFKYYGQRFAIMEGFSSQELKKNKAGVFEWVDPKSLRARLMESYFCAKNKHLDWNVSVPCICNRTCYTGSKHYEGGTREHPILLSKINQNFSIDWKAECNI